MEKMTDGWTYKAEPFILQAHDDPPLVCVSDAGWLACNSCAALIEAQDAAGLVEKSVKKEVEHFNITDEYMVDAIRSMMNKLHAEFWKGKREEAIT
jgi:hypothetical protein